MNTKPVPGRLLLLGVFVLAGCQSGARTDGEDASGLSRPLPLLRQAHGNDPSLRVPDVMLIRSADELKRLGSRQLYNLRIDFRREHLVVVALGQRPTSGYWVSIEAVQEAGSVLYVQGRANRPGPGKSVAQALTYPFCAAVIPRSRASLVHSEIKSVEDQAPPWEPGAPDSTEHGSN